MKEIAEKRIQDFKVRVMCALNLSADFEEHVKASMIRLLAQTGLPQSEGTVFSYLQNHPDQEDAIIAASNYIHSNKIKSWLLEQVEDKRSPHRDIIVEQLGMSKKASLIPVFTKLLADSDRHVRFQAAQGLYKIGGKEAALAMCDYISDPDEWISMTILRLLCMMREHESIPILIDKFNQDNDLRRKALMVSFLSMFKSVTLISIFDEGINSRDARLRANSIEAIGNLRLPEKEIRSRIESFLHDPNNRIRANTILALARSEPGRLKPDIGEMVNSSDIQLRRSAAFILTMIPSDDFKEYAQTLLEDKSEVVRKRMVLSLKNFDHEFVCLQLPKVLSDESSWIRKYALDLAARIPQFPHEPILPMLKSEQSAPNLSAAINFFITHPNENAMPALRLHAKDSRLPVVKALLEAIAAINGVEGVKWIAPRLDQRDSKVIRLLTENLVKLGERSILDDLIDRFAAAKHQQRIKLLIPSVEVCLEILALANNMPSQLLQSLETIEVVEKPQAAEPASDGKAQAEDKTTTKDHAADHDEFISQIESSDKARESILLDLEQVFDEPEKKKKKKKKKKKSSLPKNYFKGVRAYNMGKYKRANACFSKVIEGGEKIPPKIYYYMGLMLRDQRKYEQSAKCLETFIERAPDNVRANYVLGRIYYRQQKWEDLLKVFTRFIEGELDASPKMKKTIYLALGAAHVETGNFKRGIELLKILHKVKPSSAEATYYMAVGKHYLGFKSNAEAMLIETQKNAGKSKRIKKMIKSLESLLKQP